MTLMCNICTLGIFKRNQMIFQNEIPRTIASLVNDPTSFIAVSRYSPASTGPTFVIVSDGLSVLVSDSLPLHSSKSIVL